MKNKIFIGYFTGEIDTDDGGKAVAQFSLVVEAGSPKAAVDKFRQLIIAGKDGGPHSPLHDVIRVYFESCIAVHKPGPTGFLCRYEEFMGCEHMPPSLGVELPDASSAQAEAYGWRPGETPEVDEDNPDAEEVIAPFLDFREEEVAKV